ncbi:hypothetical protein [Mastigocladopsis repens]|uniref:hypothetical protein n=1 Tax=Mastigocladopsis repens TaxID=221287 RepID=UPI0003062867|nr:hypothetical protein [Mastigocladopsis repens]
MVRNSVVDSILREFPKPLDIAKMSVYALSILSTGIFLFLPFFNLLHPRTIDGFAA